MRCSIELPALTRLSARAVAAAPVVAVATLAMVLVGAQPAAALSAERSTE